MSPSTSQAQIPPPAAEAEAVVRALFEDLDAMRWESAAGRFHPEVLERFRGYHLQNARMMERAREAPPRYEEEMPEAVRAWFEERRKEAEARFTGLAEVGFPGRRSAAELESLSTREMMARFLEARDSRAIPLAQLQAQADPAIPVDGLVEEMRDRREVVGSVVEDDTLVHVLYRTGLGAMQVEGRGAEVAVATVRASPAGWRVWTVERDDRLFGPSNIGWSFYETTVDLRKRLAEAAGRVFTWPAEGEPRLRVSIVGFSAERGLPAALRFESLEPGAAPAVVEVPYEAVADLMEYLQPWLYLPDAETDNGK